MRQLALTFEFPLGVTRDGELRGRVRFPKDFQTDLRQVAAFGCYYAVPTVSALRNDGRVYAVVDDEALSEVTAWRNITKVVCGNRRVAALDRDGQVFFSDHCDYVGTDGKPVDSLSDIVDIEANFEHFIALRRDGRLICLRGQ